MTNFYLLIHMPTHMHMPEMCVYTQQWLVQRLFFFFSPWAAELWSGQATGARGEVVRKERIMAERQTAEGTAMRAEEVPGMGLQLAAYPLPSPPRPFFPPVNYLVPTPRTRNSRSPIGSLSHLCPTLADLTPSNTLDIPEIPVS